MTFLPIAERELRVAARSPRTYWSRALAALVTIGIALLIFDSYAKFGRALVGGAQVFSALAGLAVAYALFAGAALTSDCISSEKRDETLGFLFLTDLKGYDVVVGKLFATSLRSIYGLLGTFPILSLPLLLGGVRASEFWRMILVVLSTLLLSLSLGLLVSTLFQRRQVTTHLAAFLMLLLALVPFGLGVFIREVVGPPPWFLDPSAVSPIYLLKTSFEPAYTTAGIVGVSFWQALITQLILALLLLARASWLLPYSWQVSASRVRRLPDVHANGAVTGQRAALRRRPILDQNPFYWLAGRGRGMTVGLTLLIGFIGVWGLGARPDREAFAAVQGVGILLMALVTRLLIAFLAAQRLAEDKQSGALDLIITTPIEIETIITGLWKAIGKKLGGPFLVSLALYAFLIFGAESGGLSSFEGGTVRWFIAATFFILTIADSIALGWLGIWAGLYVRNVPHGAALCLGKVVLPPALVAGALVWNHGLFTADEFVKTNPYLLPALWLGLGLATDLAWTLWARQRVLGGFRRAASERFPTTGAPVRRWWLMRRWRD